MQAEQRSSFPEVQVPGPGQVEQEDIPLNYMVLSDSLEMVGVELKATWSQTRKVNGDIIQARVSSIINAWKSGKFMDISCRP